MYVHLDRVMVKPAQTVEKICRKRFAVRPSLSPPLIPDAGAKTLVSHLLSRVLAPVLLSSRAPSNAVDKLYRPLSIRYHPRRSLLYID
jgi:hypothetical protein